MFLAAHDELDRIKKTDVRRVVYLDRSGYKGVVRLANAELAVMIVPPRPDRAIGFEDDDSARAAPDGNDIRSVRE